MIKGRTSKTSALLLRMGLLSSFCRAEYQQRDEEEESEQDDADGLPEPSAGRSAADERIERAEHESQPDRPRDYRDYSIASIALNRPVFQFVAVL